MLKPLIINKKWMPNKHPRHHHPLQYMLVRISLLVLDNAPNYLVRCVIQKRNHLQYCQIFSHFFGSNAFLNSKLLIVLILLHIFDQNSIVIIFLFSLAVPTVATVVSSTTTSATPSEPPQVAITPKKVVVVPTPSGKLDIK